MKKTVCWFFLVVGFDQLTKWLVVVHIPLYGSIPIVGAWFRFTHFENEGIVFGMLQGKGDQLLPVVLIISVGMAVLAWKYAEGSWFLRFSFGTIIGGAAGNLIDRFFRGAVVDFIHIGSFAIFNIADAFVVAGAIGMGIYLLVVHKPLLYESELWVL